jgi:hypothetical protein
MTKTFHAAQTRGAILGAVLTVVGLAAVAARWITSDARTDSLFFLSLFTLVAAWAIFGRLLKRNRTATHV